MGNRGDSARGQRRRGTGVEDELAVGVGGQRKTIRTQGTPELVKDNGVPELVDKVAGRVGGQGVA